MAHQLLNQTVQEFFFISMLCKTPASSISGGSLREGRADMTENELLSARKYASTPRGKAVPAAIARPQRLSSPVQESSKGEYIWQI